MSLSQRALVFFATAAGSLVSAASAQVPPGYYDTVDTSGPLALRTSLHAVIDDHVRYPYTSTETDTWDILELADTDPANANAVLTVYKAASYPKAGGGNSNYDREHCWPSSYGFPLDGAGNYPYSDCHVLFLADSGYNSSRSNKPYRYCDPACDERPIDGGATGAYPGLSNWTSGFQSDGTWETRLAKRGDVARAVLYMDVRYEGGLHSITGFGEPDLILTDDAVAIAASNVGANLDQAFMGIRSVLLEWHAADPVDAGELLRNDVVASFQGNRNPFVDHPEWVDLLFADPQPTGTAPWINELHYDNAGADVGEFVEVAGAAGYDLAGHRLVPYNGADGMQLSPLDLSGVIPDLGGCRGVLSFAFGGLQNGSPDGLALVDSLGNVLELISWEGTFTATDGPALGLDSLSLPVGEDSATPVGSSLARVGNGIAAANFSWAGPAAESPGAVNAGQTFGDGCSGPPVLQPPTGLTGLTCAGQVQLAWQPGSSPDLIGYDLYRSAVPGSGYMKLNGAPLAAPQFVDIGLNPGETLYYVVTAIDSVLGTSGFSAELTVVVAGAAGMLPWINELHYDNASNDTGEFVEVAGPAGLDLAGWQLVGVNGSDGGTYKTVVLGGVLPDEGACVGALDFDFLGLQNGAPDGLALVDGMGVIADFISYEGSFTAQSGAAAGAVSTDVGVVEGASTPIGRSLQRQGTGSSALNFASWAGPSPQTRGTVNTGQTFSGGCDSGIVTYGCGVNPSGSLVLAAGAPAVGQVLVLELDDPSGSMAPGSPGFLAISRAAAPGFPCGLPLPGFAMDSGTGIGELLVDASPANLVGQLIPTTAFGGAGLPASVLLPVPLECALVGAEFFLQGLLVDASGTVGLGLSEGLALVLMP